uniref:Serine/threonine-protein kinase ATM n=1 Tax=Aegilops tauschii TaxID=37682 RepID=R7WG20_AEGTA
MDTYEWATWPFLITALAKCVLADIAAKRRGATRSAAAGMLRAAVRCAEDARLSGHSLLLVSVAKQLFSHILEVIKDAPSFQLEYSPILRQLLTVKEYRYQMKPRTYSNLVVLYMKKVATGFDANFSNQASSKEESFRCTWTLHVLLENPPGDYPDTMREESLFITYAKIQLKLARAIPKVLERKNLLGVIMDDLDQNVNTEAGLLWCEASRDAKDVSLRCSLEELMDLSATIFYQDWYHMSSCSQVWISSGQIFVDQLAPSMLSIFEKCFEQGKRHTFSGFTALDYQGCCMEYSKYTTGTSYMEYMALKEFSAMFIVNTREESHCLLTKGEMSTVEGYWQDIWNSLIHALPLFSPTALVADSALNLLGGMIMRVCSVLHCLLLLKDWVAAINSANASQLFDECKDFSKLLLESENWVIKDELGYSVEALSEISTESSTKVISDKCNRAHLPGHIQQQLLDQLMEFEGFMASNEQLEKVDLCTLVYRCSLLCNLIHCALLSRAIEENSLFLKELFGHVTGIIKYIISMVMKKHEELSHGLTSVGSAFETAGSILSSFQTFLSAPIFRLRSVSNRASSVLIKGVTVLLDELLVEFSQLFSRLSSSANNSDSENTSKMLPISSVNLSEDLNPFVDHKSVVDMDFDMTDSGEVDSITASGSGSIGISSRLLEWKLELVGVISTFFSVSAPHTWEILYNLVEKESDVKVHLIFDMREKCASLLLGSADCLTHVHALLRTLMVTRDVGQNTDGKLQAYNEVSNENQDILLDLVTKGTEISITDWFFRIMLIDCITHFIHLFPDGAQDMIGHFLNMLHDTDYRVRLYLARKMVVLFETWEGHDELFRDVCSNIGVKMVQFSSEIPVKSREVLAVGPQSVPVIETVLITLAHLSVHSEEVEFECAFMISAVAAIQPSQRKLEYALFDSISRKLSYASRSKYLDQLMGPILFRWVACEVSLVSLVKVQEMFGFDTAKPKEFIEHICPWLLSFLILRGDAAGLNWISKCFILHTLLQPLSAVIKGYFVQIFGLCIAAKNGTGPEKDLAETVLYESLLQLGEISEFERDDLIRKHMVSIVGVLLTVSSTARQSELPYFSREILARTIKQVVDGFMDTADDDSADTVVIDKVNIFRADRVFKLLVPKLITCCLPNDQEGGRLNGDLSKVLSLLRQLTVDADPLLYDYIRDLEPLPGLDCLKDIKVFHASLSDSYASRDQFLKFVHRAPHLPAELFLLSSSSVANEASSVLADFISRAGISDAHQVIFDVPNLTQKHSLQLQSGSTSKEDKLCSDYGISDDILLDLLKLLKTYLSDGSVEIIEVTSRTLKGILSTSKGLNSLQCLDSLDRSLLMVHSRGINTQLVEQTLLGMDKYSTVPLEDSDIWQTDGQPYEQWLCTLVSSLISHCDDIILRLCRSLVFLKVEAAELLLASALVNIAGNMDSNSGICGLISSKVEKIIFCDSNYMMKSVKLFLDALNVVRSFYVTERARASPYNTRASPSPYNTPKDGSRSARSKSRSPAATPSSSWRKVYWLSVDYLVAARAAQRCSCDFATLMYVELWCEEQFNKLDLGPPDFSQQESLAPHIGLLVEAFTHINEPDSIYGITLANEVASQIIRYEHEGNWSSALEYYDLLVRSTPKENLANFAGTVLTGPSVSSKAEENLLNWKMHKGLMSQGLTNQKACLQQDSEFVDIQYEAAWRAGNWDFSFFVPYSSQPSSRSRDYCLFNENLHSCLRALQNGDSEQFQGKLSHSKMDLVLALSNASKESTKYIHSTVLKLQMLDHLSMAWELRWKFCPDQAPKSNVGTEEFNLVPAVPKRNQLELLSKEWNFILCQTERNLDLFEPFLAFRRGLLKILGSEEHLIEHLFQSASALRKGLRFSLAAASLYELKELCCHRDQQTVPSTYFLSKLEEAKLLRAQGQHDMAIGLGKYILKNHTDERNKSDVYRLVGKWLAETRSSNSRTIIEDYLNHSVALDKKYMSRQCRTHFHLAHYTYNLFKSYEERLSSNEWQAALRLRKYKAEKSDYGAKIQELQKQLALDREEAQKIQDDRDEFLSLALEGYQRSLVVGGKYDLQVVQSYKFIPLVYQIASRLGSSKDAQGSTNFQNALASLLKKMAIDHPYHTICQLLALANGDRVKDKQRSRSSFVVDMDKKLAAENLLKELSSFHGALIRQMKQMVEIYIRLAELETRKEDTNKKISLPREFRSICQLELAKVPVVTATIPVDPNCRYEEGTFPHFSGLVDSITIMNGINAPKVIQCIGSDGNRYRQLAKSGNDDLRQDAVVPFTPSAGVVEWVNRTVPLGDYLLDRPVMHHFFIERFLQPADWFQSRLAYTRSVAASSMVGYIVGLGDRHSMNILIDEDTAEVVHIDLGVAFEQGLMLKTPERVPFRLTRDIIDGMGVTGTEGVFKRCCEKTLSVMRENKEALLTIIEVFIHDPLYKWALSPLKALQRQKETEYNDSCLDDSQEACEGNKDAARAILRVKQKLDGYEDGEMRSVEGQVRNMDGDSEPTVKAILSLLEKLLLSVLALVREGGRGTYHIIHGPVGVHITVVDIKGPLVWRMYAEERCRNDIVFERTISNDSVVLIKSNVADKGGKSKGVDAGSKNHRACRCRLE